MPSERIYLLLSDTETIRFLENAVLRPSGYEVTAITDFKAAMELIQVAPPDLIIIGGPNQKEDCLEKATRILEKYPHLSIILLPSQHSASLEIKALRIGLIDYLALPMRFNEVLEAVRRGIKRKQDIEDWVRLECKRNTKSLQKQVDAMSALQHIGRSVTALLDLDSVLKAVVDAAVELTGAEEGSLLLLDETTGELYMHAARNFQEDFVRTFRIPIHDSLPGQVLRSGKPLVMDEKTPKKIKTSYLVHTLIYVPMQVQSRVIGVLGVDNRHSRQPFTEHHLGLVSALADYAAIAVENARLYTRTDIERKKLEAILTKVEDGVIVVDQDTRIILINQTLRTALNLGEESLTGKYIQDVIGQLDLLELIEENKKEVSRSEITFEDGRVFNAHLTPIPEVGIAVTMQDITHLKELDRIKSDFVSTVSHDLRSPLTAILGYVELIDRAGPINDQQRDFIRRVQFSVNNITSLINDLLDLGRIEAGFDALKEIVPLTAIIRYAVEGLRSRIEEKRLNLILEAPDDLPNVLGNPVRLRQMIGNLLGNAVKYTPAEGLVALKASFEAGQIIVQVKDNGPGIPPADQPYIFDKFYRASNIASDAPGTGLGLAIVKSIVENHQGRIWVNSNPGRGATFTVVLPVADETL
jgi:two-component system, OmpR family, phosphate regulon sensor histidine kinase PhoR